eukprot:COSAG06_NODE_497_length_15020_cov_7.417733_6_plen_48_part_00
MVSIILGLRANQKMVKGLLYIDMPRAATARRREVLARGSRRSRRREA